MSRGQYGDAWEDFPVQRGDVFRAGPHLFGCLDVHHDRERVADLVGNVDLVYTDPPWTDAILKDFYEYSGVPGRTPELGQLFGSFVRLCKEVCPVGLVCVEMGRRGVRALNDAFVVAGAHRLADGVATYGTGTEMTVWLGSFAGREHEPVVPSGMHGSEVTEWACSLPGHTMLDPFCGAGTFPLRAAERGKLVYGFELIPRKLARALDAASDLWPVSKDRELSYSA